MNLPLAIAALLAALLGIMHSWLGEKMIIQPVLAVDDLPKLRGSRRAMQSILRFAWHLTSVYFVAVAVILLYYSRSLADTTVLRIIAVTNLISAVATFGSSRGRHFAWPIFLIIGLLAWFA